MSHDNGLIVTIGVTLVFAFAGGFIATRLRLPAIVGYILAGVVVGPFTPGFVADREIAQQLAEIGVILLMFGVGLHFSPRDLLAVRSIAIPGAVVQITVTALLGLAAALSWGWSVGSGLVLGLAISVASTVVLLRALAERQSLDSAAGQASVGWLLVQDLFTVLVLVLLPALAPLLGGSTTGGDHPLVALGIAISKVAALAALIILVGPRVVPWLLVQVMRTGSRELFTLAVLAIALGIAMLSASVFGASLALGAFLAGVVVSESELSHQAAADALPLRDAFAVLFFSSVGMLFDPSFLLAEPAKLALVLAIVFVGNGLTALAFVALRGYPFRTGLAISAGLVQIGEFSFIEAELGRSLGLLPDEGYSLILATAIISITVNPWLFRAVEPVDRWVQRRPRLAALVNRHSERFTVASEPDQGSVPRAHAILCGHGQVGRIIAEALERRGFTYLVIDENYHHVEELRERGVQALCGDAANPLLLEHAHVERARMLIIAFNNAPSTRFIVDQARKLNPRISIVARARGGEERAYLRDHGVDDVVLAELEVAAEMARFSLHRFGVSGPELQGLIQGLRRRGADA